MAEQEKAWTQGQLFPLEVPRGRRGDGKREHRRHVDRSRVTRDADVALSYEHSYVTQHEIKLGLAKALSQLSSEKREALRAMLSAPRVA